MWHESRVTWQVSCVTCQVSNVTCIYQTVRAMKLKFLEKVDLLPPILFYVSGVHVISHMSHIKCHVLPNFFSFFKAVELISGVVSAGLPLFNYFMCSSCRFTYIFHIRNMNFFLQKLFKYRKFLNAETPILVFIPAM